MRSPTQLSGWGFRDPNPDHRSGARPDARRGDRSRAVRRKVGEAASSSGGSSRNFHRSSCRDDHDPRVPGGAGWKLLTPTGQSRQHDVAWSRAVILDKQYWARARSAFASGSTNGSQRRLALHNLGSGNGRATSIVLDRDVGVRGVHGRQPPRDAVLWALRRRSRIRWGRRARRRSDWLRHGTTSCDGVVRRPFGIHVPFGAART